MHIVSYSSPSQKCDVALLCARTVRLYWCLWAESTNTHRYSHVKTHTLIYLSVNLRLNHIRAGGIKWIKRGDMSLINQFVYDNFIHTVSNYSYWPKSNNSQCVISAVTLVWHWQIWSEVNTVTSRVILSWAHRSHHGVHMASRFHLADVFLQGNLTLSEQVRPGVVFKDTAYWWVMWQISCFPERQKQSLTVTQRSFLQFFLCFNATVIITWMALCCIV